MRTVMEVSHETQFAELVTARLLVRPGLTAEELAGGLGFTYDNQFVRNLAKASDMQKIHVRDGKYYPRERKLSWQFTKGAHQPPFFKAVHYPSLWLVAWRIAGVEGSPFRQALLHRR